MDKPTPSRSPLALGVIVLLVLVCAGFAAVLVARQGGPGGAQVAPPPPGPTYLNASGDVAYTGVEACASCHAPRHASYLETQHSRSLAVVDPSREPLPAVYEHPASALRYRIRAEDGVMRIEESLPLEDGETAVLADHVMKYVMGSGTHSRAYLTEVDGFLFQAPVSWFASTNAWAISPGFDRTLHLGFARPVDPVCLSCHVGVVERLDGTENRVRLHEEAIGCERCHGPGALHDELRRRPGPAHEGEDLTIVNPSRLSREQKMDVCAQCHMDHTLTVTNPGKQVTDWRPSMPWNDVQVSFRPPAVWKEMTVVGHVDQLRQSACFKGSDALTCLTCHDPHAQPPSGAAERRNHFNGKCLTCHDACARIPDEGPAPVPPEGDDCIDCHMPRSETDVVHIAFTHHRIGLHGLLWEPPSAPAFPELQPLGDVSHLPPLIRKRNLGLAYLLMSGREFYPQQVFAAFRKRAKELFEEVRKEGLEDAEVDGALARIRLDERQPEEAARLAREALERGRAGGMTPERRCDCLMMLVDLLLRERRFDEARVLLEELGTLRRSAFDVSLWITLLRESGDLEGALEAAKRGLTVWPENPETQYRAAELFGATGDEAARDRHNRIGQKLHVQQSLGAKPPR